MGSSKAKQRRIYQKEMNLKEKHGKDKEILVHFKDGDKPVVVNPGDVGLSYPSTMFAFKFLISARFCAAVYSHITDCDETFNFWEPSHYLLFGQGFQTWEYAPSYALRSYAYLLVNIVPTWIYNQIFEPNKILLFYFHRCCLSLFCSFCEYYFYRGVCREFGVHIGRLVLLFQLFSTGMFIASCAYLPSSFSMYMTLLSIGAWFQRKYELAVFTTALSAFLSWPFAALIGLPIAVDMLLLRGKWFSFIKWSIISTIIVLLPQIRIDSLYFGRLVVSPLNIVVYNIFSPHGPTLYGVEPWTFYFLNLTLNFNIVFFAAFLTPIFLTLVKLFIGKSSIRPKGAIPYILSLAPLYLWFTVLTLQPHKEERFMFPIYPLLSLHGAISVDAVQKIYYKILSLCHIVSTRVHYLRYGSPVMNTYFELSQLDASFSNMTRSEGQIRLCLGKEWYRYPSSFFLPNDKWNVSFIKSEFRGQLPTYFQPHLNGTFLQPPNVNDANQEEPSRYVPLEACDFLVDLDTGRSTEWEPNYSNQTEWSVVLSSSYLDNQRTSQYYRLFYIPYLFENNAVFHSYNLLQSKNFTFKTQQ
ncbi:hypothetical protein M8J76_008033 [Diaphorina citri]|nr:hypothetical protein M8J76_008033 [Diaphorina citri]